MKVLVTVIFTAGRLKPVENNFGDLYKSDEQVYADGGNAINKTVKYLDSIKRANAFITKDGAVYYFFIL